MAKKITQYTAKSQDFIDTDLFDISKHVTQDSGLLVVGKRYTILTYSGDDFSNVATVISGTINTAGCVFDATGTTPTDFTNGSIIAHYETQSYTWEQLRNSLVTSYEKSGTIDAGVVNGLYGFAQELIVQQGTDKIIIVKGLAVVRKAGTAYTTIGDLQLQYSGTPTTITTFLSNAALTSSTLKIYANNDYVNKVYPAIEVNYGVSVFSTAAISGGTGDLKYTIYYDVIDVS